MTERDFERELERGMSPRRAPEDLQRRIGYEGAAQLVAAEGRLPDLALA